MPHFPDTVILAPVLHVRFVDFVGFVPLGRSKSMSMEPDGARFYDEHKSDRGWANLVVKFGEFYGTCSVKIAEMICI